MKKIKRKLPKPITHEQWIEVTRKDGQTITTLYPPNAEFERLRLEMDPPAELIYRRYNFVHGVPAEYLWTNPSLNARMHGGAYLQRMKVEDWTSLLDLELREGNTIARPCNNAQRRPAAYGPCPCRRCTAEREAEYAA